MTIDRAGPPPVILLGAGSRSGRAIRAALDGAPLLGVARTDADIVVADYAEVPSGIAFAGAVVINCVGSDRGDAALLDHLNRVVPQSWARAAKRGGAGHFIQLSSLSVHGPAETIDRASPLAPENAYGRSKLAAEKALAALADEDFVVTLLRVPILVGAGADKLAQLVRFARRTHVVPRTRDPVRRSMLSYAGLAAVVRRLVSQPLAGAVHAADPEPFTYQALLDAAHAAGHPVRAVPVPGLVQAAIRLAAPGMHRRLFASSVVAPAANVAAEALPFERVTDVIEREMRSGGRA
jgi:nucleoside-diphosphate-sugar epimerase